MICIVVRGKPDMIPSLSIQVLAAQETEAFAVKSSPILCVVLMPRANVPMGKFRATREVAIDVSLVVTSSTYTFNTVLERFVPVT